MINLIIDDEFRDLMPPLAKEKRAQLEENLLRDGIQDPLKVWNGILIDGHNRYEIAQTHNLEFKIVEMQFDSRDDVKLWIVKNQFGRRDLTAYERSVIALKIKPVIAAKAKEKQLSTLKQNTETVSQKSDEREELSTKKEIAKAAGVSHDTIAKVEKIEAQATPEIKAAVKAGDMSINRAYKEVKRAEKAQKHEERAERKAYTPPSEVPNDDLKLFCADIRNGLPQIADNSVDFIITDPPYPKEFLPLYEDLSKVAARVLKDGGSLICMTGQSYLPDVIKLLSTKMAYHWCMCYLTPGKKTQLWAKHLHTAWKPLLWFVKGDYKGDWLGDDVMQSSDSDKRFHEWGQSLSGMKAIIERMTNPNDTILDPFLGGGSTGVVAISCKRKFIGVDIEQKNIDVTESRIKEAVSNV